MLSEITDPAVFTKLAQHITQSWEWGEFRLKTPNVKKVIRLGNKNRVFQIFIHRVPYLPFTIAYVPRSEFPNQEELVEIKKFCLRDKAIFIKLEPSGLNTKYFIGRSILPQHTIYIDLTQPEDRLLRNMHEKTRYNIGLAQKKGVSVREETSPEALEDFINLLSRTESRQGFYSHYPEYYRILWQMLRPAKMVYLLSAYSPNTLNAPNSPIASHLLLRFKDFLYYAYGGSNPEFRQFMAPHLLHFEAMKLGRKLKCKIYDLWGSYKNKKDETDPFWGIYRFKSGFGGAEVDFPNTIDIPLSPLYPLFPLVDSLRWSILGLRR